MSNSQEKLSWEADFDKNFTRLGDDWDPMLRFCRLDLPEGDSRSIKSFIKKILSSHNKEIIGKLEGMKKEVNGDGNTQWEFGYEQALQDVISLLKENE